MSSFFILCITYRFYHSNQLNASRHHLELLWLTLNTYIHLSSTVNLNDEKISKF